MKILITGANGYAASNIITTLKEKHTLILTSRSIKPNDHGLPVFQLNLTNKFAVDKFLNQISPDIIIHTAAITSIDYAEIHQQEAYALNVEAVEELCNYCSTTTTWFIHFSTDAIFSGNNAPYSENSIPYPINYYGLTKLNAEQVIQKNSHLLYTICRPSVIYGWKMPYHRGNLFYDFFTHLKAGETIYGSQTHYGNPTYIEDIGKCVDQIIERKVHGIIHSVGPVTLNKFEFAQLIAFVFKLDPTLIKPLFNHPGKAPRSKNLVLNYKRSILKLGMTFSSPKQAFEDLKNFLNG
ncbi:ADP-L-glycero-D-manno-heptose-6-epimerase [Candidatus Lokiarchaeum ossiferum]|uniref:ADP-L-glycero-D-manno-heptose-6-epimerase n=1 Tax=Candidatus Lokiarchaeum ossiferum TaxID=2951803 RepID=A0ABY6HXY2_9ARCH|nr:ADP-L-glycero-D-manno-heptose-6-epimerase [Candidatus Lokiarchaeum sp. B-35]